MRRLACLASVLALLCACGGKPEPRNVLIVTIDTLRPDAIGEGKGTPAILAFYGQATHFRRARTVAPLTLPAHTTLFTGLFLASHGIHDNVTPPIPPREERSFPLLAEQFRDAGYATAAFAARAVLTDRTGIGSGFDVYDCPRGDAEVAAAGGYIPGEERIKAPIEWILSAPKGKPWFVWVHLFDPHMPYLPFPGDERRAPSREGDPAQVLYAGEVRRADSAFEKLLAAAGPETIVVLASDHGEGLEEHDEPTHGPLCYGTTIDAVLAVRGGGFDPGELDWGLRSIADVAPTLRRLCGLTPVEGDGRDLAGPPHETLVAESLFGWRIHNWGQCFSVTDGDFTLIESGPRLELFDRRSDPHERSPLPLSHPAYERLDRALERFRDARTASEEGDLIGSVPPYGELRRRGSGYLPRHENGKLLDPRAHLGTWAGLEAIGQFVELCRARRDPAPLEEALRALEEIARRMPQSPLVYHYRADVCAALAEMTGEAKWLGDAAWSEIAAIQHGYAEQETVLRAIHLCVHARDREALDALVRSLRRAGRRLEGSAAAALIDATELLSVDVEPALFARAAAPRVPPRTGLAGR